MKKKIQELAFWASEMGEFLSSFMMAVAMFMLLILYGLIFDRACFLNNAPLSWTAGLIFCIPVAVFICSAIVLKWLTKRYIRKIPEEYVSDTMILEVDKYGKVVKHSCRENLIKSLPYGYAYYDVNLGSWFEDQQEIHHEFTININPDFELLICVKLILKKINDFDPQRIFYLLSDQTSKDLRQLFIDLLKMEIADNQNNFAQLAASFHRAEISESQFCEQIIKAMEFKSPLANLKVSQLIMEKPIRFTTA